LVVAASVLRRALILWNADSIWGNRAAPDCPIQARAGIRNASVQQGIRREMQENATLGGQENKTGTADDLIFLQESKVLLNERLPFCVS